MIPGVLNSCIPGPWAQHGKAEAVQTLPFQSIDQERVFLSQNEAANHCLGTWSSIQSTAEENFGLGMSPVYPKEEPLFGCEIAKANRIPNIWMLLNAKTELFALFTWLVFQMQPLRITMVLINARCLFFRFFHSEFDSAIVPRFHQRHWRTHATRGNLAMPTDRHQYATESCLHE